MREETHKKYDKAHILLLVLDSCRIDTFRAANKPNIDKIGETIEAGAFGCFTIPSMLGYLSNFPPKLPFYRPILFPDTEVNTVWASSYFGEERGYQTALLSANPMLFSFDKATGLLSSTFDFYEWSKYNLSYQPTIDIAKDVEKIVDIGHRKGKPTFMVILLMDTHMPYSNEESLHFYEDNPELNIANQTKAVEYVDKWLPAILTPFLKTGKGVHTIITADHGDLMGEEINGHRYWGHDPRDDHTVLASELFKIPFVETFVMNDDQTPSEKAVMGADGISKNLLSELISRVGIDESIRMLEGLKDDQTIPAESYRRSIPQAAGSEEDSRRAVPPDNSH